MPRNKTQYDKLIEKILKDRIVRRAIATKRLKLFFSIYLPDYIEYETAPFQEEMFEIAEDKNIRLAVIAAFRGSAKSTIITTASTLWSILGNPQKKFVWILSQTEEKARQHLLNIKQELEGAKNGLLRKDLGPFQEERGQWGASALFIPKFNAKIMIGSVEKSTRGLRHRQHRPDLIILDDVEDLNSTRTQQSRNKTFDWFTNEVIPAAGDRKKTKIIMVGTPLHEDSLMSRLRQGIEKGGIDGVYRAYPIVDEGGQPFWPAMFPTPEDIEAKRKSVVSSAAWTREFLLGFASSDDPIIRPEWIQFYDKLPSLKPLRYVVTGIDPAKSKEENACYTAMVSAYVFGEREDLEIYIAPNIVNKRLYPLEIMEQAKFVSQQLNRSTLVVEDVAFQGMIADQLRKDGYDAKGMKVRGQNGSERLSAISHLVQSGKTRFPQQGAEILIHQLTGYNTEKYKDLADAFSILELYIVEKEQRPQAQAGGCWPEDHSDLNNLNSRARMLEINRRKGISDFFKI